MSTFNFEGEIDGISEQQLEFVSGILSERGYKNGPVMVSAVGKIDDNYVANVRRFEVEKDGETFRMIAKIAPANEFARTRMNTKLLFETEHVMYTCVLPKFSELEKEANVPENERLRYAACYGTRIEEPNEIILLEDLQVSNFVMLDKTKSLTDDTVKLVLKNFARLHSLSYSLNHQDPDTYEALKRKLVPTWLIMLEKEDLKPAFEQMGESIVSMLDNDKYNDKIKSAAIQLPNHAAENCTIDKDSKFAVIQQGDSWTNNILFTVEDNKTVECCMIDYQVSSHNSPAIDIQYMIFNCTDYETRSKHYLKWIDYYHEQLDRCLNNFGLKANVIYPREQLEADLKRCAKMSFGLAMMLTIMLVRETHENANMKESMKSENKGMDEITDYAKVSNMVQSSATRFKVRVNGLVNSFLELGYL